MTFRLLVLASHDPTDFAHGMGLVVGNTIRQLYDIPDLTFKLGFIRYRGTGGGQRFAQDGAVRIRPEDVVVDLERAAFSRTAMLRGMTPAIQSREEREFARRVGDVSGDFDVILWLGYTWDSLSLTLPRAARCPVVFHCNDSISLFAERNERSRTRAVRLVLARAQERRVLHSGYGGVLFGSHADAEFAVQFMPPSLHERVLVLPNGVAADVFRPSAARRAVGSGPAVLLFTGVMDYGPNVAAARALAHDVLPRVTSDVTLRLVGKDPTDEVLALRAVSPRVRVTGPVADITAEYQAADVFVAPIHHATGTKNKVLEALASGLPVITTTVVKAAFPSEMPGLLLADTPEQFARAVDDLVADSSHSRALGIQARDNVVEHWSWRGRTRKMVSWLQSLT